MKTAMRVFPQNFLWGAAASSHQVEGGNTNNDWWCWEQQGRAKEPSGEAARHFELFEQDFQLARDLHHNAHRFSIEWSRVEPREGCFDDDAVDHYREVIRSLRQKSIEPVVTLHHFTNPKWFADRGGWLNKQAPFWFTRYAARIVDAVGSDVRYWITINEPMVFVYHSYLTGLWPPGQRSVILCWKAARRLIRSHQSVYKTIHGIHRRNKWVRPQVSIAHCLRLFRACPRTRGMICRLGVFLRHQLFNLYFLREIKDCLDFIGANYYEREYVSNDKALPYGFWGGKCNQIHGHVGHVNTLGWDSCPGGFYEALCWLREFRKPIFITENGTCEDDDAFRQKFIQEHLQQVQRALNQGLPVIGYLYWSLLDNFEWHQGFGHRFGLIDVDYETFKRTIRPSGRYLAEVIQRGRV